MYGNCAGIGYFAAGMLLRKINFKAKKIKYCHYLFWGGDSKYIFINILCG